MNGNRSIKAIAGLTITHLKLNFADRRGRVNGRNAERPRVGGDAGLYCGATDDREVRVHACAVPQSTRPLAEEVGDRSSEARHPRRPAHQHHPVHVPRSYNTEFRFMEYRSTISPQAAEYGFIPEYRGSIINEFLIS